MLARRALAAAFLSHLIGASAFSVMSGASAIETAATAQNLAAVDGLAPNNLWRSFAAIASIPRPSKKEERVLDFLKAFSRERGLATKEDAVGNLVVLAPGRNGGENAKPVVLQGHVDMVCEKNSDTAFDFDADPIRLMTSDGWITAEGTTLGADNGIGCATILALLMDDSAVLPPLECLFTIDEETGMTGAIDLDASMITGDILINLDTEEFGSVYVGCAGGGDSKLYLDDLTREALGDGMVAKTLKISGLVGGHSGVNIHEGRGNAIMMACSCIKRMVAAVPEVRLAELNAGDKHNAICREAIATVYVPESSVSTVSAVIAEAERATRTEYGIVEKNMKFELLDAEGPGESVEVLSTPSTTKLCSTVLALPHGVIKMSAAMEDLVETSNNVAVIRLANSGSSASLLTSTRSSVPEALEAARDRLEAVTTLAGGRIDREEAYPGWNPNMASPVLSVAKRAFNQLLQKDPEVIAIHAGLECGLLGHKKPGLDMVSLGPTITGAHSPDEQLLISTVAPFYDAVALMLKELAGRSQ